MFILKKHRSFESLTDNYLKAYEKKDFQKCLYESLRLFKLLKTEEQTDKIAVIRMIRFSAEKLIEELQSHSVNREIKISDEKCSFCQKAGKDMKFIYGADVQICHNCVKEMHDIVQQNKD